MKVPAIRFLPAYIIFLLAFILCGKCFGEVKNKNTTSSFELSKQEKAGSEKHTSFRILTEEFPPYNFTEGGEIRGISTEIVREILGKMNYQDNIEVMTWSDGYNLLQNEDNIILFSTTKSPVRENLFKWVGPLVPNNTAFFARKGADLSISGMDDARKVKNIGVYKDDFGELLLKEKGFTNLDSVKDNKLNVKKLVHGDIDLWIINELTGKHMAMKAGFADKIEKAYDVQKDYMYIAFSKSTPDSLIQEWQNVLDEIKTDGTFAQIFSKWIMFSYSEDLKPGIKLTEKEKRWIKDHPIIKAAFDPNWPPVEWIDDNGNYVGLTKDYVDLIRKKLNMDFEILHQDNWSEVISKAKNREIDIIIAAAPTSKRKDFLLFTEPYLKLPSLIVVNNKDRKSSGSLTMDDLKGKKVSVVSNSTLQEFIEQNYPEVKLDPVNETLAGLLKVSFGKTYATLVNNAAASYYIEKEFIPNLRIAGKSGYVFNLSFASRKDWPELNRILQKGVSAITPGERQAIFQKWVSLKEESWRPSKEIIIAISVVLGLLVTGAVIAWFWSLKKQVIQRTEELNRELLEHKKTEEELKRAYAKAEAANIAKSGFLANMSHEIRTPMNGIIGMVELLLNTEMTARQYKYAGSIERSAQSLLTVINDILDFSKIEAGKLDLEPIPFDLQAAVEDVAHFLTVQAEEKKLELLVRYSPNAPKRVVGDAGRIRQILMNLVSNAIKFTEDGHVMIDVQTRSMENQKATFQFSVEDTGIGIAPERREHIFGKFSQEDTSTTRKYGGTGLGLAICKQLVQLMNGEIGVTGKPGEGSTFTFSLSLPIDTSPGTFERMSKTDPISQQIPDNIKAKESSHYVKKRESPLNIRSNILLVEDNVVNRDVAVENLEQLGCKVELAGNGREAVDLTEKNSYDLILMDCQMPVMDGFEATKLIREQEKTEKPHTTIVAMTAGAMKGDRERCMDAGMDDYLVKPVRQIALLDILLKYCKTEDSSAMDHFIESSSKGIHNAFAITDPSTAEVESNSSGEVESSEDLTAKTPELSRNQESSVFSIADTLSVVGGKVERMKRLIEITREDSLKQMEELGKSLEEEDIPVIERTVHTLKGQAANLGAEPFRNLAAQLEQAARGGQLQTVRDMMDDFKAEYEKLINALDEIDWNLVQTN